MAMLDSLKGLFIIPGPLSAWPTIVFWALVFAAMMSFAIAVKGRRTRWAVVGAILAAPFCIYVSGYPAIRGLGLVVLSLNASAAVAVWRGRTWLGAGLLVPFVILASVVAAAVLAA